MVQVVAFRLVFGAVVEAIQNALAPDRFIKDRHPFFNASLGGGDRRDAGLPLA